MIQFSITRFLSLQHDTPVSLMLLPVHIKYCTIIVDLINAEHAQFLSLKSVQAVNCFVRSSVRPLKLLSPCSAALGRRHTAAEIQLVRYHNIFAVSSHIRGVC